MLEIINLSKTYKGQNKPAINKINLSLKPQEIFGILGLNGAGKSTTFKCITGIQDFDEGQVIINNYDLIKEPLKAKKEIGYIPDNHQTFEELTGREYIYFMADVYKVSKKDRDERIKIFSKMFQMEEALDYLINSYSHGMKQKIAIMAGIIHYPKLWILDEPLVGLDIYSMEEIMKFMKEYKKLGNTILFSSHIISIVKDLCDRVAIINQGEIKGIYNKNDIDKIDKIFKETVVNDKDISK